MRSITLSLLILLSASFLPAESEPHPLTFEDFIALDRVSDPQISPDGQWVAFVVTDYSLEENGGNSDIWLVPSKGGEARQLTSSPRGDSQPSWSPDGQYLAFASSRGGSPQIYVIALAGGEARLLSDLETGVANLSWSPDGSHLLYSADVTWPPVKEKEKDEYPTDALVFDELFYRHWDEWRVGKRSHLFTISADGGESKDRTSVDADVPTIALGGYQDLSWAPDSKSIAFVMNPDEVTAIGTNNDLFLLDLNTGQHRNLTRENQANDNNPLFSPDGRLLAYRAQMRAGFESDRTHLMLLDPATGTRRDLTPDWQLSVGQIAWSPDGSSIYALVQQEVRNAIYRISTADGTRTLVNSDRHWGTLQAAGDFLVATGETVNQPDELYRIDPASGAATRLTHVNDEKLSRLKMNPAETFWYDGALGEKVQGLLIKPPQYEPGKRYPLVYLIHGGPQGAWSDSFHPRWNYQMFAAPGYVVAMVNFHGSTGYGQDFTDSITGHWGDYPYEDVMKGVDYLLANYDFIDPERTAAAGASYGGYMINWLATQTDRFRSLVNHDGVFNMESMYGTTEELWFPEWEFHGTLWKNRELYRKWSPHTRADKIKTPMLIIHGQLDYRVDVGQGLEVFTTLRRNGVPARFVYFPDEGHWVLQPRNRRLWWKEVLGWITRSFELRVTSDE